MSRRENNPDWKIFQAMLPELRERYLRARNEELMTVLADARRSPTERFWEVEEQTGKIARTLRDCLDGHTRSKMFHFMRLMLRHGMMTPEDLAPFTLEVRELLHPHG